ncbi:MAG TPA: ABC transporter permease [Pyrinomonadaceae bacterium]|nr:ABC transporter permease [Pyrinomonadaceae bacterium]
METFIQDLKHGARMLIKTPGFTAVAVLTLALGIGANTAIFSVVNAVLLRPLPFTEPQRLIIIGEANASQKGAEGEIGIAPANYVDYAKENKTFERMGLFSMTVRTGFNLGGAEDPERLTAANISSQLFPTLGVNPIYGRQFFPDDEKQGNNRSVILSYDLWQRRFGADPGIINKPITLNGASYQVVGVMPQGFQFPTKDLLPELQTLAKPVELWVPLSLNDAAWTARGSRFLHAIGRLKPGVTIEQARADLNTIAARLAQQYEQDQGWTAKVVSLQAQIVGSIRLALLVLFGAVGFVLLIACSNVANLLLARAATRQKEIAVRLALGANRLRLVRQLLTEGFLLVLIGGPLGMLLAVAGVNVLVSISPQSIPLSSQLGLDARVVAFTLVVSFLTVIIFGLVPALQSSKVDLSNAMKEGGSRGTTSSGLRVRNILVVSELVLAAVLLVGAGLMVKSFMRLQNVDPGFDPNNVLTFQYTLPAAKYPDDPQIIAFNGQLIERLKALPGVDSVSGASALPLGKQSNYTSFTIDGQPPLPPGEFLLSEHIGVFPDYFKTMHVQLRKGRDFTAHDTQQSAPVVIINEAMANQFWPNDNPIGKSIKIDYDQGVSREIIGIVNNIKNFSLDTPAKAEMYVPQFQFPFYSTFLVVHGKGDPKDMVMPVTRTVAGLDKDQPIYNIKPMTEVLNASVARQRFTMLLMSCFAALAAILAAIGLYGVMSYSVSLRSQEMGIRMALGSQRKDILKLIIGHGLKLAIIGVVIGLIIALGLTRLLQSLLFGISANDPVTFIAIALLLAVVAVLASIIPARRAMRVDPMVALRYE